MAKISALRVGTAFGAVFCLPFYIPPAVHAEGPAVSGPNGKIDIGMGASDVDDKPDTDTTYRLGGSIALPLGQSWGLQGDASIQDFDGFTSTGTVHLFTRDPQSYLVGATAGIVHTDTATLTAYGAEAELYVGRFSLEGWAGYTSLDYDASRAVDTDGFFGFADLGYYATDNLRMSVGVGSVLGYQSLSVAGEYQPTAAPVSVTADARFGEDGSASAMAGLKLYLAPVQKSLIERHRQDDPRDRGFDLFTAAGSQTSKPEALHVYPSDFSDESSCRAAGFTWVHTFPEHCA